MRPIRRSSPSPVALARSKSASMSPKTARFVRPLSRIAANNAPMNQRDLTGVTAQRPDVRDSLVDLDLPAIGLGHNARDRTAMARDADGLASLHLVVGSASYAGALPG